MISVVTLTNRGEEALQLVKEALDRQTWDGEWEWIISVPDPDDYPNFATIKDPPKDAGDYWGIYKAYNNAVKEAVYPYILSVQDYTFFDPDALEKLAFNARPNRLITGVGNKYDSVYPLGTKIWQDPREDGTGNFRPCQPNEIEWNFALVPVTAIKAVGGFDEYMDKYSGICGLDVLDRLSMVGGYEFYIDQSMKTYSLDHGRPVQWDERNGINGPYWDRRKMYEKEPILPYLH